MVVSVSSSGQMLEKGRPLVTSTDALAIGKRTENQEYGCCVTFLRLSSMYVYITYEMCICADTFVEYR